MKKLFIFKFMGTTLVAIVMLYPFWSATENEVGSNGVLESLRAMEFFATSAIVAAFILGVALYRLWERIF